MYKILCTGNPEHFTVARAIKQVFPYADFASRATGYDLRMWTEQDKDFFKSKIVNYDVLVNSSFISNGAQQQILEITRECWTKGHVFNIGSTSEYDGRYTQLPLYSVQKRALRELSLLFNTAEFKTTHIVAGGLKDGDPTHADWLDPLDIAKTIKWVLEQSSFSIPLIGLEKLSNA
jgi:hypothetical protein